LVSVSQIATLVLVLITSVLSIVAASVITMEGVEFYVKEVLKMFLKPMLAENFLE